MSIPNHSDALNSNSQRVKQVADLIVAAILRLNVRGTSAHGLFGEVGLDNAGEPRVHGNPLKARGGQL